MDVLDNAVWHALTTHHRSFADAQFHGTGEARRYMPDTTKFAALPDDPGPNDWRALGSLVGPNGHAALFRDPTEYPSGWSVIEEFTCLQMVADGPLSDPATTSSSLELLTTRDASEMAELVAETDPGPWGARTQELGEFLGIRVDERLAAMAGERIHAPGHREISAVCTLPEYRGRGFAAALVTALVIRERARDELPFLHVLATNKTAISVYERIGMSTRREIVGTILRAPA